MEDLVDGDFASKGEDGVSVLALELIHSHTSEYSILAFNLKNLNKKGNYIRKWDMELRDIASLQDYLFTCNENFLESTMNI